MKGIDGLFAAELRRFFSRRVMRGAFAFGIALSTLVLVIITVRSSDTTVTENRNAFVCTQPTANAPTDPSNGGQSCSLQTNAVRVEHDRRVRIHDNLSDTVKGTGVAMVFVAMVIGASFIGAEYGSLSLISQLVFEPRRARVIAVKATAVAVGLVVLSVALLLYIALLQLAGSSLRGVVSGLDGAWFAARAGDFARVAAAVALAGVSAFAITVVAHRTVAAVAGLILSAYVAAAIGQLHNWRFFAKYNPTSALLQMALDPSRANGGNRDLLTVRAATVSSCVWAVGLTAVAAAIFARREVR